MQSTGSNRAVIAAAGACKTKDIIDEALAKPDRRILITTYTTENLAQIKRRIEAETGVLPDHIDLLGWFGFLLRHGVRPFQAAHFGQAGLVRGLNFLGDRPERISASLPQYYLDSHKDVWREAASALACKINQASDGDSISRLEDLYDDMYVDEVQDLVGWDLGVLDLLLKSRLSVTAVGDPRQHTYSTNRSRKNIKYQGTGFVDWLNERADLCQTVTRNASHRCNQEICDFASDLFPDLPRLSAVEAPQPDYYGVHTIEPHDVPEFYERHRPQVLRFNKTTDTLGLPAINIGLSKGSTFDHVLIFTTKPMRTYLQTRDPSPLRAPENFYVAVTRARYSVTLVV